MQPIRRVVDYVAAAGRSVPLQAVEVSSQSSSRFAKTVTHPGQRDRQAGRDLGMAEPVDVREGDQLCVGGAEAGERFRQPPVQSGIAGPALDRRGDLAVRLAAEALDQPALPGVGAPLVGHDPPGHREQPRPGTVGGQQPRCASPCDTERLRRGVLSVRSRVALREAVPLHRLRVLPEDALELGRVSCRARSSGFARRQRGIQRGIRQLRTSWGSGPLSSSGGSTRTLHPLPRACRRGRTFVTPAPPAAASFSWIGGIACEGATASSGLRTTTRIVEQVDVALARGAGEPLGAIIVTTSTSQVGLAVASADARRASPAAAAGPNGVATVICEAPVVLVGRGRAAKAQVGRWSPRPGSNRRPAVYKTAALPTELHGRTHRRGYRPPDESRSPFDHVQQCRGRGDLHAGSFSMLVASSLGVLASRQDNTTGRSRWPLWPPPSRPASAQTQPGAADMSGLGSAAGADVGVSWAERLCSGVAASTAAAAVDVYRQPGERR